MTSDEVFKISTFYLNLFKGYELLSEDDIRQSLIHEEFESRKYGWTEFGKHIYHMRNQLLKSSLGAERNEVVLSSLARQQKEYEKYLGKPEARPTVEGDRESLIARRFDLVHGFHSKDEEKGWMQLELEGYIADLQLIPKRLIEEVDKKLEVLNYWREMTRTRGYSSNQRPFQPLVVPPTFKWQPTKAQTPGPLPSESPAETTSQDTSVSKQVATENFSSLFALGFTITDCDNLMKKLGIGANFKTPTSHNAKIWALLYLLEDNGLLNCSAPEAAQFAGDYFSTKMSNKPYNMKSRNPYQKARKGLKPHVENDIAHKKYGPNRS